MATESATVAPPSSILGRFSLPFLRRKQAAGDGGAAKSQSPKPRRRFRIGKARWIALLMLVGFIVLRFDDPAFLQSLRLKVFDIYQQIKPRPLMDNSPVVIVDLDDASLDEIGQWPWPRNIIAQMVANLFNAGVGAVGFDVIFSEPDRMNPNTVVNSLVGIDDETRERLKALPSNDAIFGDVIRQARRVVVGQSVINTPKEYPGRQPLPTRVGERATKGAPQVRQWIAPVQGLLRNVPELEGPAAGHGLLNIDPEVDGIVRRVPSFYNFNDRLYPTLSIELMRIAMGRTGVTVLGDETGVKDISIAPNAKVNTDKRGIDRKSVV